MARMDEKTAMSVLWATATLIANGVRLTRTEKAQRARALRVLTAGL